MQWENHCELCTSLTTNKMSYCSLNGWFIEKLSAVRWGFSANLIDWNDLIMRHIICWWKPGMSFRLYLHLVLNIIDYYHFLLFNFLEARKFMHKYSILRIITVVPIWCDCNWKRSRKIEKKTKWTQDIVTCQLVERFLWITFAKYVLICLQVILCYGDKNQWIIHSQIHYRKMS